jgi:Icc-related predicted phosphoesterase
MRILHVSDLHSDSLWYDWVSITCGKFDLLVVSGDFIEMFSKVPLPDQVRAVSDWIMNLGTPMVVCSGNHDYQFSKAGWISDLKGRILGIDGDAIEFGGLRIGVKGWWGANPEVPLDILVAHAPPSGTPCAASPTGRDNGDQDLWELEFKPRWILCGHVHDAVRNECVWPPIDATTLVLNPGFDGHAEIPNHWILDTTTGGHVFRGAIQD